TANAAAFAAAASGWSGFVWPSGLRPLGESVGRGSRVLPHRRENVLRAQLFLLHVVQRDVIDRENAELRVAHLAVELLVALIQRAEFGIGLHQRLDLFFVLLEHQLTSSLLKAAGAVARPKSRHRLR